MKILLILVTCLALLHPSQASEPASEPTAEPGTLRVCARPNPGFLEKGAGGPVGLELDLLSSFAQAQGLRLDLVWLASFKDLLPSVESGLCDVGSAGVMVTEQRALRVDFSTPYFPARILFVESKDQVTKEPDGLRGKRVAVVGGTLHEEIVAGLPQVEIVTVEGDRALFEAVTQGRADGAVCDSAIVLPFLSEFPQLAVRFPLSARASFAFALPPGSPLKADLDRHLDELRRDGRYRLLLVTHFGEEGANYILDE